MPGKSEGKPQHRMINVDVYAMTTCGVWQYLQR
jgi:hypothetical protein